MDPALPFDPVERSAEAEHLVLRGGKRLYHRFRAAPYYGGIATADAVGCNFLCAYCWSYSRNLSPRGTLCSPKEVAEELLCIAQKKRYRLFRITGSEPVLGEESLSHLTQVLGHLFAQMHGAVFILETNGFMLGYKKELCSRLRFPRLRVRVSLKGTDECSFERISGARKEFFPFPLQAITELRRLRVEAHPAIMADLFEEKEILTLKKRLTEFGISDELEEEFLERYPSVLANLARRGTGA